MEPKKVLFSKCFEMEKMRAMRQSPGETVELCEFFQRSLAIADCDYPFVNGI